MADEPANFCNISVHFRGDTLKAVRARAAERSITLGKAAISLIDEALSGGATAPQAPQALLNLADVSSDDLLDELVSRLSTTTTLEAAIARAEAAEAKLLAITSVLAPERAQ
ncbi:hypothetical protein ACPVPU_07420 [Sphingomonas sp. CJ99]